MEGQKMLGSDFAAYLKRTFKRTDKDTEIYEAMTDVVMELKSSDLRKLWRFPMKFPNQFES